MAFKMKSHTGIIAVRIFLFFAATMALLAGTTLVWRGSILDRLWVVNAPAYAQLARLGKTLGVPFLLLGAILMVAGAGWFRRRLWGWRLAVAIVAIQENLRFRHGVGTGSELEFRLDRRVSRAAERSDN